MLTIQLLGHFLAERDGQEMPRIRLNGAYRLLALMALKANCLVRNTSVATALWPDTSSLDSLRKASQTLREALGPEAWRLRSENNLLRLDATDVHIDVVAFDGCFAQKDYQAAIDLYKAPLLQGWEDAWITPEREALNERFRTAVTALVKPLTDKGELVGAARLLYRAVLRCPHYEDWWELLMTTQVKSGARLEALATAQRYADYLEQTRREQGIRIPPSSVIKELIRQLQTAAEPIAPQQVPDLTLYEAVGGATPLGSRFYVERPEDLETHYAIGRRDSIVLIKGARQTGKSSLLARCIARARREGVTVLRTAWHNLPPEDLTDAAAFYRAQAQSLADQLKLSIIIADAFSNTRTPSAGFTRFLIDQVFATVNTPLLWAIDDADRLFSCPFRDDVFALFRAWHNERAFDEDGPWHRFTMVLAYSAEAHLSIRNLNQSPFNVGVRVTLGDFTAGQLAELNTRYGAPLESAGIERLYALVGGHPYLVRRALQEMATRGTSLDEILSRAERDGGIFADHLNRMLDLLRADADLYADLGRILAGAFATEESSARLCAAGLLVLDVTGAPRTRCRLYDLFLRRRLL